MKKIYMLFFFFFLISQTTFGADKMRIAIMDLKGEAVSEKTTRTISNMLRTELINIGTFVVIERAQMDSILEEQGLQQTGCTDQSCVVEMGKLLSAKKILVGEVSTLGKAIVITIRIVDVEKGISEFGSSEKADSEDNLDKAVYNIARKLTSIIEGKQETEMAEKGKEEKKIKKEKPKVETELTPGYIMRGFVPGWAQVYSGHKIKGIVIGSAFLGSAAWAVVAVMNYYKSKNDYESMEAGLPKDEYKTAFEKYETNGKTVIYSLIGVSAIYVLNWLDVLFLSAPEAGKQFGMVKHDNLYFNLSILPDKSRKPRDVKAILSASVNF